MISTHEIESVMHGNVHGTDGDKIGGVGQVYLDNTTGEPEWVTVSTGLFGTKHSFVPLAQATVSGNDVHVPFGKDKVKDAPRIEADGELTPTQEDELYTYYGMHNGSAHDTTTSGITDTTGRQDLTDGGGVVGRDTSGPTTDHAMTRSEEQLNVGTRTEESGRARLRKYVVTEEQTATVPVSHEEVTISREPITEANRGNALDGPSISEEEHEVTLHAERPVVGKETVPVERIALGTETVTGEETITEGVRKEQVEVHDDTTGRHGEHDHAERAGHDHS